MKVLLVNGSPRENGNTSVALAEVARALEANGIESQVFWLGTKPINDCIACGKCSELGGRCVIGNDVVNELIEAARIADGFVFGTPVYYAHPTGRILSALDRAFYAGGSAFAHKPAACVAVARRGGTTASFDVLNKYFTIKEMPVVSSTYWNNVHGCRRACARCATSPPIWRGFCAASRPVAPRASRLPRPRVVRRRASFARR